mgnify:CR=1 FL=1
MAQSIKVVISGRDIPLKVNSPEHEELIRKAASEINRKVKFYLERYPGKSLNEIMSLVALNTGIAYAGLQKQMETSAEDVSTLLKELEAYLDNIEKK